MRALMDKLGSGRWLLTVLIGIVFMNLCFNPQITAVEKNVDKIFDVIELVIMFYFLREDRTKTVSPEKGDSSV